VTAVSGEGVWSAEDTTPAEIEEALIRLQIEQAARTRATATTRVCNLVVIVDREWKGEISRRLAGVGRYFPSRLIMCAVEEKRTRLAAWAAIAADDSSSSDALTLSREHVEIDMGPRHLRRIDTIVDPVRVNEVTTIVWSPHGHHEAVEALLDLADVVLLDTVAELDDLEALDRAAQLTERTYVVDLAWLRSVPWRERLAAAFDPPERRTALAEIGRVEVRHEGSSEVAALLLLGWLASRLGWPSEELAGDCTDGRVGRAGDVELRTRVDRELSVPGLGGVTIVTRAGDELALNRGSGGLRASRRSPDGAERSWTVLGRSRGEGGILGEGVRQGLLRDLTYGPALRAARAMAG
jgi:glucose-6-phosphate dehydrogenase assembly protein OpcA